MRFYGQAKGRKWHTEQPLVKPKATGVHFCRECHEWKPSSDFCTYQAADGMNKPRNICKRCISKRRREQYREKKF